MIAEAIFFTSVFGMSIIAFDVYPKLGKLELLRSFISIQNESEPVLNYDVEDVNDFAWFENSRKVYLIMSHTSSTG